MYLALDQHFHYRYSQSIRCTREIQAVCSLDSLPSMFLCFCVSDLNKEVPFSIPNRFERECEELFSRTFDNILTSRWDGYFGSNLCNPVDERNISACLSISAHIPTALHVLRTSRACSLKCEACCERLLNSIVVLVRIVFRSRLVCSRDAFRLHLPTQNTTSRCLVRFHHEHSEAY